MIVRTILLLVLGCWLCIVVVEGQQEGDRVRRPLSSQSQQDQQLLPPTQQTQPHRHLVTLQEKWALTENGFTYSDLSFALDFLTSDFILDEMARAQIYTDDCAQGNTTVPSTDLAWTLNPDDTPAGVGNNSRGFVVDIVMNTTNIANSVTYSEETVGEVIGTVRFCVRFGLWTNSDSPIEVNFLETLVTLTVDLTDGFSIDTVNVRARDALVRTATQAYEVEGYQCDNNNVRLTGQDLVVSRNQGEIIRVCVTPNQEARDQEVFMRYIDNFSWQRDYGGAIGVVTQAAVEDREAANNALSELFCTPGSLVCAFETILFASMYRTPGAVTGSGVASMQFGDDPAVSRRNLRRTLQEDDESAVAAVAEFDMDLEVVPVYNPHLEKYRNSAAPTSSLLAVTVAPIALSGLYLFCWC